MYLVMVIPYFQTKVLLRQKPLLSFDLKMTPLE